MPRTLGTSRPFKYRALGYLSPPSNPPPQDDRGFEFGVVSHRSGEWLGLRDSLRLMVGGGGLGLGWWGGGFPRYMSGRPLVLGARIGLGTRERCCHPQGGVDRPE